LVLASALRISPEYQRLVVFRLGRFLGVQGPGISLLIPLVDRAVAVDLRERVQRVEGETILTQDRKRVAIDLVWSYQVVDPARSVLEVEDLESAAHEILAVTLRSVAGSMERHDLFANREQVGRRLRDELGQTVRPWGVEVRSLEIRDIGW
jgi:regulator of protease activity HflC (stomatin/prohibitin superfamily)